MQFTDPSLQPHWYFYVAYFFGGAFLVNAVPHFVQGVSGRSFPTPFASPPGRGLSSPTINVLWGTLNAVIGYVLISYVGVFHLRSIVDAVVAGIGGLLMALMLSRTFGQLYAKSSPATDESTLGTAASTSRPVK